MDELQADAVEAIDMTANANASHCIELQIIFDEACDDLCAFNFLKMFLIELGHTSGVGLVIYNMALSSFQVSFAVACGQFTAWSKSINPLSSR